MPVSKSFEKESDKPIDNTSELPRRVEWYRIVQSPFNSCNPETDNTTFLQVFFAPVIYCDEFVKNQRASYNEEDFYNAFKFRFAHQGLKNTINNRIPFNPIKSLVKHCLDEVMNEKKLGKIRKNLTTPGFYNNIQNPGTYKHENKDLIYNHYVYHCEFFLDFIKSVLMLLHNNGIEEIHQIEDKTIKVIGEDFKFIPTPDDNEVFSFTSYYLYSLILLSINPWKYKVTQNSEGRFSGLTVQGDINTIRERNDYMAVTEYYPVNTVERLGALEFLAEKDNIYALQELYFMYQHNTVLYNIYGKKRGLLLKAPEQARSFLERLKKKNHELVLPMFRHDPSTCKGTYYSELAFYLNEYAEVSNSTDMPDEYRKERIINILKGLSEIFNNKTIPFNIELVWFINQILTEHAELKSVSEIRDLKNDIGETLQKCGFTQDLKLYDDDVFDLLELLLDLKEKGFSDKLLIAVCCECRDGKRLDAYYRKALAIKRETEDALLAIKRRAEDALDDYISDEQTVQIDQTIFAQFEEKIKLWECLTGIIRTAKKMKGK